MSCWRLAENLDQISFTIWDKTEDAKFNEVLATIKLDLLSWQKIYWKGWLKILINIFLTVIFEIKFFEDNVTVHNDLQNDPISETEDG